MKVFLVMPGYNEGPRVGSVIRQAKKYVKNLVFVDDGSEDDTFVRARETGVEVLRHSKNLGKASALRTGADYACKKGADAIVFMDSDQQHDPKDIPILVKALKNQDVVFACRDIKSKNMPFIKRAGNSFFDVLFRIMFSVAISDTQSGFKIMTRAAYERLDLKSKDYNVESEIAAKTARLKLKFSQIPIETVYKDALKGTGFLDGVKVTLAILRFRFSRF